MTKEELIQRLNDIEWEDFEVKEAKSEVPKSSWETVGAFSNTAGGWLVFGVKQKGKSFEISGVNNSEKLEQDSIFRRKGLPPLLIPKEIRKEMGEILTPGYPIAKGITQLTN